jgi:hypothetical protein
MGKVNKKVGLGSFSLLICVMGILFAFSFGDKGCLGDVVLELIGLKSWSNGASGRHYTIFYTPIFFIPSVVLGHKFKNDLGATFGKVVSSIFLIFIIISLPGLAV